MEELIMDAIGTLQQKKLLRVDKSAQMLNVSRWTVYRWVETGPLGGARLGVGSLRTISETVAALIDLHCVGMSRPHQSRQSRAHTNIGMRIVNGFGTGILSGSR